MKDLTKGNITKVILQFAFPILIGLLFNMAYSLADTRIIGSFLGNDALAAVGSISMLSDLMNGFIVGVANGFAVITAQYFGKKKMEYVRKTFGMSFLLGGAMAIVLSLVCILGIGPIMNWLNIHEEHQAMSKSYVTILLMGLIFCLAYNVMASNLRAIGDAFTPLLFLILAAILNVGLDLLCVGALGLGVAGAAAATIASQLLSAVLCFLYAWKKYPELRLSADAFAWDGRLVKEMMPAGLSMGFMSCLVNIGTLTLQTSINTFATNIIVAHTVARKISNIFFIPFTVLSTSMATFCGQNYGAGRMDRIKSALWRTLGMGWICACLVILVSYTICPWLIVAISGTTIDEVIETAWLYHKVDSLFYFILPVITILRSSLQGMGDHITPIVSSTLEMVGKIAVALLLAPAIGYMGLIVSEPIVWIIMVIPLIFSTVKRVRRGIANDCKIF